MKYYQQFSNNKKSNRRKWITIFNLNGLLILLNDNLTFTKNILFNIIEGMKKTNGNISINWNSKKNFIEIYILIYIYISLIYFNEYISVSISNNLLFC